MSGRSHADTPKHARARRLGRQLRALREASGRTRTQLAAASGVPLRTLTHLETEPAAQPGLFTVAALADALGVTVDVLVAASDPVPGLWSTGYEGRTIDSFVTALIAAGVDAVADIRLTPISRKAGFSKSRLSAALLKLNS
jgi:transcriptional regulator with XRE-family HTH domain